MVLEGRCEARKILSRTSTYSSSSNFLIEGYFSISSCIDGIVLSRESEQETDGMGMQDKKETRWITAAYIAFHACSKTWNRLSPCWPCKEGCTP